jgi:hypothetical protein
MMEIIRIGQREEETGVRNNHERAFRFIFNDSVKADL